jgi:hypothetical protein
MQSSCDDTRWNWLVLLRFEIVGRTKTMPRNIGSTVRTANDPSACPDDLLSGGV